MTFACRTMKDADPKADTQRRRVPRLGKSLALGLALVMAVAIGIFDYVTAYEFAVSAFYLIPVCVTCWRVSRRAGLGMAEFCALIWLYDDIKTGPVPYRHSLVPLWNGLMLLVFFVAVVYSLAAFRDAHGKLQHAQAQLEQHNRRLEEAVRQRTAALEAEVAERKRLEKAKLQAERLAMVGTIAAQVAHEVRNPLGSITLNLDLIAKEIEKLTQAGQQPVEESRALVHEMREEVRRIQHVIEEYLRFARLPKLQRRPVRLNDFLQQKLDFMASAFEHARVKLHTDFDQRLKAVNADPEQLWQAILNLVQNSLEAMPAGGALGVSTVRQNGQALLRVSDNGKGMTPEQQEQLFVPFFTTKPRGTGLGLSLTQRILNEHSAQVECVSVVGKGTTFTISFPLEERI